MNKQATGAAQTLAILQQLGVSDIFGYPGGAIMPMYDALYSSPIKHYLCRHEQGAAFAAIGYARASGNVGVCMATSGPGATNLLTGLADAMSDSVPVVAITGQVATRAMGSDAFQEVDIIGLSLACTKHSFQIRELKDLPTVILQAFEIATSGRPGPVLIDIPKDIQQAGGEGWLLPVSRAFGNQSECCERGISNKPDDNSEQLAQLLTLLNHSKRPLFYIGGGVGLADAVDPLRSIMQSHPLPSVCSMKGLGTVGFDQPHYLGMIGMHGSKAGNLAIQQCDLMIVLGARFDDRATGKLDQFAPYAKVIHLDIDPAEVNKRRKADVALLGDLKTTLLSLQQVLAVSDKKPDDPSLIEWQTLCQQFSNSKSSQAVATNKDQHDHQASQNHGILAPQMLQQLSDRLQGQGSNNISSQRSYITTDVGQHQMWAAQHMRFSQPNRFISSSGIGTMGFGIPSAIGVQVSDPKAQVICISGDGSFMMNVQELATIKRYQLPVKIVLIDNQKLGLVRQWQQLFFEQRYSETDLSDNPDFIVLAKAFDISAETISRQEQVSDAFDRMLNHQGAYLLHVKIDAFENVWPLVPPDTANDKMMDNSVDNSMANSNA